MSAARRVPKQSLEDALRAGKPNALRRVTDDVDPNLVADTVIDLWGTDPIPSMWHVARTCQQLPARAVDEVLRRLKKVPQRSHAVFLLEAVRMSPAAPHEAWGAALRCFLELNTQYAWGSKQLRERVTRHAAGELLPAMQAAAVAGTNVPLTFLAVLARDASEASLDALLAYFSAAAQPHSDDLLRLRRLKTHAAQTPAMRTFLATVEKGLERRASTSGVLDFARALGLDVKELKVHVMLRSESRNAQNVSGYQGSIDIDSRAARWFHVSLSRVALANITTTYFTTDSLTDRLKVGRCEAQELPAWLAKAQQKLKVRWSKTPHFHGSLRGKKRQAFIDWLFAPSWA